MDQQPHGGAHQQKKVMAVLAYLGILIIIPFIVAKEDPFVKFHLKQGLILFIAEAVVWLLGMTVIGWELWQLLELVNLATLILAILGIVNVVQGNQKELPLVGSMSSYFTF